MAPQSTKKSTAPLSTSRVPPTIKTGPAFFEEPNEPSLPAQKKKSSSSAGKTAKRAEEKVKPSRGRASNINTSSTKSTPTVKNSSSSMKKSDSKSKAKKTKIIVKYNCGMPNTLFIRGEGISTLSWDRGEALQNTAPDEWVWESDRPFASMECKILINDAQYELGQNHTITYGTTEVITPQF